MKGQATARNLSNAIAVVVKDVTWLKNLLSM